MHRDLQFGFAGGKNFGSNAMSPNEQMSEAAMCVSTANEFSQSAKRKVEFDAVFQPARRSRLRNEKMSVLPAPERAGDHRVAKHT